MIVYQKCSDWRVDAVSQTFSPPARYDRLTSGVMTVWELTCIVKNAWCPAMQGTHYIV